MKTICTPLILAFSFLFSPFPTSAAAEGKYDVLAQTLAPFVNLVAKKTKNPNRAVELSLRLEQMPGLPIELAGARATVQLQHPDKLRLHGPVFGQELTLCRNGQRLWVYPASKLAPLLELAGAKLPSPNRKVQLRPFQLPIPEKQLVFFPALFQVEDLGAELLDGVNCRVLDLELMPELAKGLGVSGWSARLWVGPDYVPQRIVLSGENLKFSVRFDAVKFSRALPESTFEPGAEESADLMKLTPADYQELLKVITRGGNQRR